MLRPNDQLKVLADTFTKSRYNIWFVGGCVRDSILGHTPKDVDLCTDANPDEQIELYEKASVRYFETGLQHGTITVRLGDDVYEITSLRTETDHDGRHATVHYTRSLEEDLSRRDLTINAMAQDFNGNLIDLFGGQNDLKNGVIKFVGDPAERMKEDYLRILRYFRFWGRYGARVNNETFSIIHDNQEGLKSISAERIWMEMKSILSHDSCADVIWMMDKLGINETLGFPIGVQNKLHMTTKAGITNPIIRLGIVLFEDEINELSKAWKWSNHEIKRAREAYELSTRTSYQNIQNALVDGGDREVAVNLAKFLGYDWQMLQNWDVPIFPVNGNDIIESGITPGPNVGYVMKNLRNEWKKSGYLLNKKELLTLI